jgi:group II intron reverse transcriptase/maturase
LGKAALEDKIVQQALVRVMEAIYEVDFLGFSYGFRPRKGPHNALDAVYVAIMQGKVNWVLDADIKSFFDTIEHKWMVKFIEHRIRDPRVIRLIKKFLRAGVLDGGRLMRTEVGTPQGSVLSPLLANVYLHYVLDLWVNSWRKRYARGKVYIVRYADDSFMGFQYKSDAERFLGFLKKRLAQFGLEIQEKKTRLIEFGRFAAQDRRARGDGKPETFDFLGFTHICARRRSDGKFTIRRRTMTKRLRNKLKQLRSTLMSRRHEPVTKQGSWIRSVVQGHFNYYAVPGNQQALQAFRTQIVRAWNCSLRRRSQKARNLTWDRFARLITKWVPSVRIVHPYPNQRLCVCT